MTSEDLTALERACQQGAVLSNAQDDTEEWKAVPGLVDVDASTLGRVRSWRTRRGPGKKVDAATIVKVWTNRGGYLYVRVNGKSITVHKLVLLAFAGPKPDDGCCCHNNGDKTDNRPSNLRWDTQRANCQDKIKHGTIATGDRNGSRLYPERMPRGSRCNLASINEEIAAAIFLASGSIEEIARLHDATQAVVRCIKSRRTWRHVTDGLCAPEALRCKKTA